MDRKAKVIRKAAKILAPVFGLYRWVWGWGELYIPTETDIEQTFRSLAKDAEGSENKHTSIKTGRLIVVRHENQYTVGLTLGTYTLKDS